eukprot:2045043-Alexandrium_andersonii.AAC.1
MPLHASACAQRGGQVLPWRGQGPQEEGEEEEQLSVWGRAPCSADGHAAADSHSKPRTLHA